MKIRFMNSNRCINAEVKRTGSNTVKIYKTGAANLSGFKIYKGNAEIASYTDYTTLYKQEEDGYILSNDESVFVPEVREAPAPETVESAIAAKAAEFSARCNAVITAGVINNDAEYSYTVEDQKNLKTAFDMAVATGLSVPYHANGESCRLFTAEEIIALYVAQEANLTHHVTYNNQLRLYIGTLETAEAVRAVDYGTPLTGTYLETYNTIMQHSQTIIQAIVSGGDSE